MCLSEKKGSQNTSIVLVPFNAHYFNNRSYWVNFPCWVHLSQTSSDVLQILLFLLTLKFIACSYSPPPPLHLLKFPAALLSTTSHESRSGGSICWSSVLANSCLPSFFLNFC